MFRSLQLLLPALLPSWGFFDYIQPSPRIQYQLLDAQHQSISEWHEFRPRPATLSFAAMLGRLLWNPHWNETLFMMSCAERIAEHANTHSEQQILDCIVRDWQTGLLLAPQDSRHARFRLLFVQRQQMPGEEIRFTSRSIALISRV